jgi:integrase
VRVYKNQSGKWSYSFVCNNQQHRKVIGLSRSETEEAARIAWNQAKRLGFGLEGPKKNIPFEDFVEKEYMPYSKKNKRSWKRDEASLKHLKPFFKGVSLNQIGPSNVEKYKTLRSDEGASPSTTNIELALLKTIFSKGVEWGKLETNPAAKIKKFKVFNGRLRILTAEEAHRLLPACCLHLRLICTVALNTGMRKGEILGLRWADVNFGGRFITIEAARSKSGKERRIPMNALVLRTMATIPRVSEFVFTDPMTKRPIADVKTAFHAACRRAKKDQKDEKDPGIVGLCFHDLRHTAATWMLRAGANPVTVQKILGHSNLAMTLRYLHATEEDLQRAVDGIAGFMDEKPV